MSHHLPPMQPLWSFASAADAHCEDVARDAARAPTEEPNLAPPVQHWHVGEDGHAFMHFSLESRA
jgi:hypothetical protein